ncbi:hypothetical protein OC834_006936 [Tilletia horrida]|nr:hypothetical protein OC834_006936 [Tilletia horrida]
MAEIQRMIDNSEHLNPQGMQRINQLVAQTQRLSDAQNNVEMEAMMGMQQEALRQARLAAQRQAQQQRLGQH